MTLRNTALSRGTKIGSEYRVRKRPHPTEVCTKPEEDEDHQGNSENGRPTAVDDLPGPSILSCERDDATLPPNPDCIFICDIADVMVDVMFSPMAELAPRFKRLRGA